MPVLWLWWNLLPVSVRRLTGAFLLLAVAAGGIALAVHRYGNRRESVGYARARDSVWVAEIKHRQVLQDSLEAKADSAHQLVITQTNTLALVRDSLDAKLAKRPTGLRMEPLPDSFAHVPSTDKVRVIVASTGDTVDDVPRLAAVYWFRTDSLLGIAKTLLDKYAAANKTWSEAWSDEHAARIGADSLTAMYAERLRTVQPAQPASRTRRAVTAALWLGVGFIAAKHIR